MSNVLRGVITNPDKIYGKSAYEIAVMHGFDGTEEEWVKATDLAKEITLDSATKAQYYASLAETANENAGMHETDARESAREAQAHLQEVRNIVDAAGEKLDLLANIPDDYITLDADVKSNTALIAGNKADIVSNERAIAKNAENITRNSKRITNIEQGLTPDSFETDDSMAYQKDVPANALPYAEIKKIGGMTYKDGNTLRSAKVTEVKSVGANLWNFGDKTFSWYDWVSVNLPAGSYSFGALITSDNTVDSHFLVLFANKAGQSVGVLELEPNIYNSGVVTLKEEAITIRLYAGKDYYSAEGNTATYANIILAESPTALTYTPYVEHTIPIPEAVRPANGINENVYDFIEWAEDGTRKSYKKVEKVVFDGNSTVHELSDGGVYSNRYCVEFVGSMTQNSNTMLSHYDTDNNWATTDKSYYATGYSNGAMVRVIITDSAISSLADFSAFLADQYEKGTPVTFCYELAEPEVTDISDLITADNLIGVEGGGTLTFENECGYAVPSEVEYQVEV